MTQQIINVGTGPNTGTGDNLRAGMVKVNSNFTDLYSDIASIMALVSAPGVTESPTFAALPPNPSGFYFVVSDETKNGQPTLYLFTNSNRYWVAMTQDL
jgi:hypothetical protein